MKTFLVNTAEEDNVEFKFRTVQALYEYLLENSGLREDTCHHAAFMLWDGNDNAAARNLLEKAVYNKELVDNGDYVVDEELVYVRR